MQKLLRLPVVIGLLTAGALGIGRDLRARAETTVDAATDASHAPPPLRRGAFALNDTDRTWWSFQPLQRPVLPPLADPADSPHPIDRLLQSRLRERQLRLSPPAPPRERIRRAYFDLIGLPPTPEAVDAFVRDPSPEAWTAVIDDLLLRPQYGERWARHWLDLVRYAETNGYERDGAKPQAWRYRDYVINAFNTDKPYTRFVEEQLAGDELPGGFNPEALIATGYYRLHVWDDEPDSTLVAEYDDLDDIMVTTGAAFLGLTVGCARCHDHKFDPFSQADYYRFLGFIRSINPYGLHHQGGGGRGAGKITQPLAPPAEVEAWQAAQEARIRPIQAQIKDAPDAESKKKWEAELKKVREAPAPFEFALAVAEGAYQPTRILARGDVLSPTDEVHPGIPTIFHGTNTPAIGPDPAAAPTADRGRRLALARWITRADHPLTARVWVNRLWQHHFGQGLSATPNDFGRTGAKPSHPALLDYLAARFIDGGWTTKEMHRLIMTSQAYQMSSRSSEASAHAIDEGNTLFWRQNVRRAEAEVIRDTVLAISGSINLKVGGPSFYPTLPPEVHGTQDSSGKGWKESPAEEQDRRSIYLYIKRALLLPLLETFDYTTTTVPLGTRPVTTVAPQALTLLNDPFIQEQGKRLAERLVRESAGQLQHLIDRAFALTLQRSPTPEERARAAAWIAPKSGRPDRDASVDLAALNRFCVAMLNLNEVWYVD